MLQNGVFQSFLRFAAIAGAYLFKVINCTMYTD